MNQTLKLKLTFSKKSVFWLHHRSSHLDFVERSYFNNINESVNNWIEDFVLEMDKSQDDCVQLFVKSMDFKSIGVLVIC